MDENYTIEASQLIKNEVDGKYVWEIQIFKQEGNQGYETSVYVDAKTGKTISVENVFGFNNTDEIKKDYKDIDKSYAKEYIKKLKGNGIYLPGENYYPEKDIVQKEYLYLLLSTKGYVYSFE